MRRYNVTGRVFCVKCSRHEIIHPGRGGLAGCCRHVLIRRGYQCPGLHGIAASDPVKIR